MSSQQIDIEENARKFMAEIGENPFRPACITGDGSTFYKSKMFRKKLDYYVKQYINDETKKGKQ